VRILGSGLEEMTGFNVSRIIQGFDIRSEEYSSTSMLPSLPRCWPPLLFNVSCHKAMHCSVSSNSSDSISSDVQVRSIKSRFCQIFFSTTRRASCLPLAVKLFNTILSHCLLQSSNAEYKSRRFPCKRILKTGYPPLPCDPEGSH